MFTIITNKVSNDRADELLLKVIKLENELKKEKKARLEAEWTINQMLRLMKEGHAEEAWIATWAEPELPKDFEYPDYRY